MGQKSYFVLKVTSMSEMKIKYLTQDELRRLFSVIKSKRDKAMFLLAYRHGLRASEVGLLTMQDVNFKRRKIYVHRIKGSLSGEHLMGEDEISALRSHMKSRKTESDLIFASNRGQPISRKTIDYLMKKYAGQAGLPEDKRHFHCLKHSIATHLVETGADVFFIREWIGHKNIQNTLAYSQMTNRIRDEKAKMFINSSKIV
jgi:site-specific recombinase XerD